MLKSSADLPTESAMARNTGKARPKAHLRVRLSSHSTLTKEADVNCLRNSEVQGNYGAGGCATWLGGVKCQDHHTEALPDRPEARGLGRVLRHVLLGYVGTIHLAPDDLEIYK